jgi:hypothetical protein
MCKIIDKSDKSFWENKESSEENMNDLLEDMFGNEFWDNFTVGVDKPDLDSYEEEDYTNFGMTFGPQLDGLLQEMRMLLWDQSQDILEVVEDYMQMSFMAGMSEGERRTFEDASLFSNKTIDFEDEEE